MRCIVMLCFFFIGPNLFGQLNQGNNAKRTTTENPEKVQYVKPGVLNSTRSKGLSLSFGRFLGGDYSTESNNNLGLGSSELSSLSNIEFKIKVPVFLSKRTKVLVGYGYYKEQYNFNNLKGSYLETIGTLENKELKSNGFSAIVSHSINEKNYLAFRYKFSANGNYDGLVEFDVRNSVHNFLGMFGVKKSENFEFGFGLLVSKNFRRTSTIPFLLYNRTFNKKWGIEAKLPANIFLRHNFDKSTLGVLGFEYNSKNFRLDVENASGDNPLDFAYNHSEVQFTLEFERHLYSWFWANLKLGYQQNFASDFDTRTNYAPTFQAKVQSGPFFQMGIFVSPSFKKDDDLPRSKNQLF